MTRNPKIVIDTNVLVAASIIENVKELGIAVSHRFYSQSRHLFSVFIKRQQEKIGILTPTVRSEAFSVLSKAVKDVFIPTDLQDVKRKQIFYDNAVGLVNSSEHRMRHLAGFLLKKYPNPNNVRKFHDQVKDLSMYLKDVWNSKYRGRTSRIIESERRSENIETGTKWKDDQKDEVYYTHEGQVHIEARQLEKFMRKWPNRNDEMILAETLAIRDDYTKISEEYQFYIVSCDTGFFSPLIYRNTLSDIVTKEIKERFGIICNLPKVIQWIVDPVP